MAVQHQRTPAERQGPASGAAADFASSAGTPFGDADHAPPVVAVVVTHDPGPMLEECLASLGSQDYPNLSVLVVDAASTADPLPRVAAALPDAYVRHLDANPGFGAAANEVLEVVDGASFYLFCHDDVLLDTSAVRALVEEAFRSNAGVVGPKLVAWGDPGALLQVGLSADKTGVTTSLVEEGERDQEQHDRVRDVFAIPGACTLVRADLFTTLGGFDPGITFLGEDLDLCWRAQVAGSRVVVVPAARTQHREGLSSRRGIDDRRRLFARHRLRTMLTCYGPFHLLRVLPQAALLTLLEAVYALAAGQVTQSIDVLGAWTWNARRFGEIRRRRRALRSVRGLRDAEVRRLQGRGSARLTAYLRGELGGGDRVRTSLAEAGRGISGSLRAGPRRLAVVACVFAAAVVVVGSRALIGGRLPAFGSMIPIDEGPLALLRDYASGWRSAGLGGEAPAPTAFALLGLAGLVFLGGMGLLQQVLVLGTLPLGLFGAWRLTRPLGSMRARAVGLAVYAVVPLPYDALARGRWDGLVMYAAAPWILARLLAGSGEEPFAGAEGAPRVGLRRWLSSVAALGLVVALVAAFVPLAILVVPLVAVALLVGSLLTGGLRGGVRTLALAVGASVVALLVHLPWSLSFLPVDGGGWAAMAGISPLGTDDLGVGELLQLETGGIGLSALGWGVSLAGALALFIGRGWRLAWAARVWVVALACWALVWAGGRSLLGVDLPPAEVLLAPAAASLALAAALGMAAFERDLRGFGFGLRQVTSLVGAAALTLATVPVALAAVAGDWGVPGSDFNRTLTFMSTGEVAGDGAFRVLWLGDPEVLPVAGHRLGDRLAYGLSRDGPPGIEERWSSPSGSPDTLVAQALRLAANGRTERLGRLLGPLGVRYVVLAERAAPERTGTDRRPLPEGTMATFAQQLDLRSVEVDPALTIYENAAWVPVRAALASEAPGADLGAAVASRRPFEATVGLDLSSSEPVLGDTRSETRFRGEVDAGPLHLAEASSSRWELRSGEEVVPRARAFGWSNVFAVGEDGQGVLRYRTSPLRWLAIAGQAALWLAVVRLALLRKRDQPRSPRP